MKMNEKFILLYLLIVLMVTTNSKYTVANAVSYVYDDYEIEETIAYWTPERMKNAGPLTESKIRNGKRNRFSVRASNLTSENAENADNKDIYAIGKLFFHIPGGGDYYCTASVINTDDGNIGLTAAHCIFGGGTWYKNLSFCPGSKNGQCPLGSFPVKGSALVIKNKNYYYDYGMTKFDNKGKLQDKTGYLNWDTNPGNEVEVTMFGYPADGDLKCNKNRNTLCMWQGKSVRVGSFRTLPTNVGHGSSGGPWIRQYDPKTKSGWIVASSSAVGNHITYSPIYAYDVFTQLIREASAK